MKATWKKRGLGEDRIREALRTSRSLTEAAKALDVDRSTLHRWIEADPSLKAALRERVATVEDMTAAAERLGAEAWARSIEAVYELSSTERVLLDLARQSLELAHDAMLKPAERLAAMGRFQRLVEQLNLEAPAKEHHGKAQTAKLYSIK